MNASEQTNPIQNQDGLVIACFVLGLTTLIFPTISILYLTTANGGPGYLQSLFCGIPFAAISVIAGIVSLAQGSKNNKTGSRMAISGILFGSLFFGIALILEIILLFPFLSGTVN